jgi:hypothetical protein
VNATPGPLYLWEGNPVPIVQETLRAPGPVWMGMENLAATGIRTPDRPGHFQGKAVCPRHEGTQGEQRYSSAQFLTSALDIGQL